MTAVFQSKWKDWTPRSNAQSYDSFGSSCPSGVLEKNELSNNNSTRNDQPSRRNLLNAYDLVTAKTDKRVFASQLPNPVSNDSFLPWDSDLIWEALTHGEAIPIYSLVLNEWIYWVWGQREKERFASVHPTEVIYSYDELDVLAKSGVTQEGLKALHEAKRILEGRFTDKGEGL